jgi:hypothetical protein
MSPSPDPSRAYRGIAVMPGDHFELGTGTRVRVGEQVHVLEGMVAGWSEEIAHVRLRSVDRRRWSRRATRSTI